MSVHQGENNLVQLNRTRISGGNPMVIILVISTRGFCHEGFMFLRSQFFVNVGLQQNHEGKMLKMKNVIWSDV